MYINPYYTAHVWPKEKRRWNGEAMRYMVPVWCQYDNGFREPEGDVIVDKYPEIGDELTLCDKKVWIIVAVEGDPELTWPKIICERKKEK